MQQLITGLLFVV